MEKATYSVKEAAAVLGVSLPSMYDITEQKGFPLLRVGRKKLVLKEKFHDWMEEQSRKNDD